MSCEPLPGNTEQVLAYLAQLTEDIKKARSAEGGENYQAYLHGQLYGAALVLRLLYPGPGKLGETAALMVRPVITEHECQCED